MRLKKKIIFILVCILLLLVVFLLSLFLKSSGKEKEINFPKLDIYEATMECINDNVTIYFNIDIGVFEYKSNND